MPSSDGHREHRRRRKVYDLDRQSRSSKDSKDKDRGKDKERGEKDRDRSGKTSSRSSRSKTASSKEQERAWERYRTSVSPGSSRKMSGSVVPEMERRASAPHDSKVSTPYPSFSKAHSKEKVSSSENVVNPRLSLYTPDPTDMGGDGRKESTEKSSRPATVPPPTRVPPSPPLTASDPELKHSGSNQSIKRSSDAVKAESRHGRRSSESERRSGEGRRTPISGLRENATPRKTSNLSANTGTSRSSTPVQHVASKSTMRMGGSIVTEDTSVTESRSSGVKSSGASTVTQTDSDATPGADPSRRRQASVIDAQADYSPPSASDHSPQTPTLHGPTFPSGKASVPPPHATPDVRIPSVPPMQPDPTVTPPPPPPPPAATLNQAPPRVDYLLQNGGLPHLVPKSFLAATQPLHVQSAYQTPSPRIVGSRAADVPSLFVPFQSLLDDYCQVMGKSGSIAVATGYRSVARRLLDRLEAVFARSISSETCNCIMCQGTPQRTPEDDGISWGEILEYVSGRRELPPWPPFSIANVHGLGLSGPTQNPMQKLDIDVPEEWRDHYVRQSKKTKAAVQEWLGNQPELPSSPPQEIDDETLTFAIVTHLEPEKRQLFTALLRGMNTLPPLRSATPMGVPKPELITKTAFALQRLYRLQHLPRDAECAIYLLRNPHLHAVIATLSAVSEGEWEILISGRFDGFLWSGAESLASPPPTHSPVFSRGPSRAGFSTTPFSPVSGAPSRGGTFSPNIRTGTQTPAFQQSRGATPAPSSFGAPVQMDEETEIAALAEVEREIYLGMEALEDAFEALHVKAEVVRQALRERGAGLQMAASARRGSQAEGIEVMMGTPASMFGGVSGSGTPWDSETDDGLDDLRSELLPDDSASNISSNRRRRREGRGERRTPAMVEEEDEGPVVKESTTGKLRKKR